MRAILTTLALQFAIAAPAAADDWLYAAAPGPEATPDASSDVLWRDGIPIGVRSIRAWHAQAGWLANRLAAKGLRLGDAVHLRIFKHSRELDVYLERGGRFVRYRTLPICDVSGSLGPKRFEGDLQAPEGFYSVRPELLHPNSDFHLAFNLGYPNAYDRALGRTGSNIMIHGGCASRGCFAISDYYMEQLWVLAEAALRAGQERIGVEIYPFRMSDANLRAHAGLRWFEFWRSLKPAHDHFVRVGRPAPVEVGVDGYRVADDRAADLGRITAP